MYKGGFVQRKNTRNKEGTGWVGFGSSPRSRKNTKEKKISKKTRRAARSGREKRLVKKAPKKRGEGILQKSPSPGTEKLSIKTMGGGKTGKKREKVPQGQKTGLIKIKEVSDIGGCTRVAACPPKVWKRKMGSPGGKPVKREKVETYTLRPHGTIHFPRNRKPEWTLGSTDKGGGTGESQQLPPPTMKKGKTQPRTAFFSVKDGSKRGKPGENSLSKSTIRGGDSGARV